MLETPYELRLTYNDQVTKYQVQLKGDDSTLFTNIVPTADSV
jgi:hypothetical protein